MAKNFKIEKHKDKDIMYMILKGDFDGSSAWELINLLKEGCKKINKVVIKTDSLGQVYQFGKDIAFSNLYMVNRPLRIKYNDHIPDQIILEFTN